MIHLAVVKDGDEICHFEVAPSAEILTERLGEYVAEHADLQLTAADARRLRRLLSRGRVGAAVDLYFEEGGRWAPERLLRHSVAFPDEGMSRRTPAEASTAKRGLQAEGPVGHAQAGVRQKRGRRRT